MVAVGFQRSGSFKQFLFRVIVQRHNGLHLGMPACDCPCFVHGNGLQGGGSFEESPSFDQHPIAGGRGQRRHDADRRGDDQGAGAGDHQQHQGLVEPRTPRSCEKQRGHERHQHGEKHHGRRVDPSELLDPLLSWRAARLSLLDHADDAAQRGVLRRTRDTEFEGACLVDGSREDLVPQRFAHRDRLAGDGSLVDGCRALCDHTVERQTFAGPDQHDGTDPDFAHGFFVDIPMVLATDACCRRGDIQQRLDRATRPRHTPGLQQKRQREEKGHGRAFEPFADGHGTNHGQRHQEIHVGTHAAHRRPRLGQNKPATG